MPTSFATEMSKCLIISNYNLNPQTLFFEHVVHLLYTGDAQPQSLLLPGYCSILDMPGGWIDDSDLSNTRYDHATDSPPPSPPTPLAPPLPLSPPLPPPTPETTQRDLESWPTGRLGPFVSDSRMRDAIHCFQNFDRQRTVWSRTEEKVLHVAEFSRSGREIFVGHVTEPQLATLLKESRPEVCFRLFFAASQRGRSAIYSTYTRDILSACGAPSAVWAAFLQDSTSSFDSFTDTSNGNATFHGWMALRLHWKKAKGSPHLLSEPYLSWFEMENNTTAPPYMNIYPRLYLSYNAVTKQTTIITTGLDRFYLCVDQHLRELFKAAGRPEEIVPRLLLQWFAMAQECFAGIAEVWDVNTGGTEMAAQTLDSASDHEARVRQAEFHARSVDYTKGDFTTLRSALTSMEECHNLWNTLKLDLGVRASLSALFKEQKQRCQVTANLLDNLVSRYDRFLNLLLNYTNIRMVEGIKKISEDNAKQSESMAIIAYDTKRDSEVMKAITVVTMIYLPATFTCTVFSMGLFNYDFENSKGRISVSEQGWIYMALALPLTALTLGLSYAWMRWTAKRQQSVPIYSAAAKALMQADDSRKPRAGTGGTA